MSKSDSVIKLMPCAHCGNDAKAYQSDPYLNRNGLRVDQVGVNCNSCGSCIEFEDIFDENVRSRINQSVSNWNMRKVDANDVIFRLKKLQESTSPVISHQAADDIVCHLLNRLGFSAVVDEYAKTKKIN